MIIQVTLLCWLQLAVSILIINSGWQLYSGHNNLDMEGKTSHTAVAYVNARVLKIKQCANMHI